MTRVLRLTERRPRAVELPSAEVDFLLASARGVIDVVPTFARGVYTLTPRGWVGFVTGPTVRYAIRPKVPWPNLRLLLGLRPDPGTPTDAPAELLEVLATAFADELDAVSRVGFASGYGEADTVSPFLRGRLRTADQLRDAAARAFPDRFHIAEPVFDLSAPWNQIPKATATALLRLPELSPAIRQRVNAAADPLSDVSDVPLSEALFAQAVAEPRAAHYRPLLDVCRMIWQGLTGRDPHAAAPGAFLLNLERAFERYLTGALTRALAARPEWEVESQPEFQVGPVALAPDILLRHRGAARAVVDAKWKPPAPDAADLHQVLAYAALTGAPRAVLVYPGRTDARHSFTATTAGVRVTQYRLRLVGPAADLLGSVARLARQLCKG